MVSIIATYFSVKALFLTGSFLIDFILFDFQLLQTSLIQFDSQTLEQGRQLMWWTFGLSFIPVIFLLGGIISGGIRIKKEFVEIFIRDLPEDLEGFKIVQLSDIHLGSFFRRSRIAHGVDLVNEEDPDLICVTGDLVNFRSDELQGFENILSRLKAKFGVFSVLGNHDYGDYTNWPTKQLHLDDIENIKLGQQLMGWDLLLNEHRLIKKGASSIGLIGVENWGKGFRQSGDFDLAIQGLDDVDVTVLLSHDPSHFTEIVQNHPRKMHLTLAGHTHGFQMGVETKYVRISPARIKYKYWGGLYEENDRYLYVNRGFGFLGYPGRIGIPSEITVLTLTSHPHKKFEKSTEKIRHNVAKKRK